ncbi:MAG: NifB/NifX family molybdenum-iron cluster-binding protein [bacterium]
MKVAVSSTGTTLESAVDPRFGRARHFILFDTETGQVQAIDNVQSLNSAQGAGIQSAETLSRSGARWVITGHCGPKAFRTLQAAGVQVVVGFEGTVREAVERFQAGGLRPSQAADVEGHW